MQAHLCRFAVGAGALCIALSPIAAQTATLPPIRKLGPIVAQTAAHSAGVQAVRALSDGRLLVNIPSSRLLWLIDSSLKTERAIAGPPGSGAPVSEDAPGVLLAARGDTSFLLTGATKVDVIDPDGKIVRSIPLPPRAIAMGDLSPVRATGDRQGRILFIPPPPFFLSLAPDGFMGDTIVAGPEFVPLLRLDPSSLRTDTVATVRAPRRRQAITRWQNGGRGTPANDPFATIGDDWTVLSDGTIGIVRLRGYSTEWITPAGAKASGPAIAHAWTSISRDKKRAMMESMRVVNGAAHADSVFPIDSARYDSLALVAKANPEAITNEQGKQISLGPRPVHLQFVAPSDLPDSEPPFAPAATVADSDGNLWIENYLPARPGGGIVYDVVNKTGVLVDRVELPALATVAAFMPGFVFLRMPAEKGAAIAKARIR